MTSELLEHLTHANIVDSISKELTHYPQMHRFNSTVDVKTTLTGDRSVNTSISTQIILIGLPSF